MVNAIGAISSSNVASVSVDNEVKNLELPKHLGTRPWDTLAEARKNYENALKSGSLEDIVEAGKKIAEAHKGDLTVSCENNTTKFTLKLPI